MPSAGAGFSTSLAAMAGAAAFADMTAIQVLGSPRARQRAAPQAEARASCSGSPAGPASWRRSIPKPGVPTGGPFQSIQTSSPGIRISELMPKMAARLKDTCIIRSLNTRNADHGSAAQHHDARPHGRADVDYPDLGAVLARELGLEDSQVPDYVSFYIATEGRSMAPGQPRLPRRSLSARWT